MTKACDRCRAEIPAEPGFEYAVIPIDQKVKVEDAIVEPGWLALVPAGAESLPIEANAERARLLLLGGRPLGEPIEMWWNFVARSKEEITEAWRAWQSHDHDRFGPVSSKLARMLKGGDSSTANGSSIAFLAKFAGKSCMFLADAHMKVVCASLRRLGATPANPLHVDAVKMAHHGSRNNITKEFFELVDAKHWLISSNGDKFSHPDKEAMQAVIQGSRQMT